MLIVEPFIANKKHMMQIVQESSGSLICIKVLGKFIVDECQNFIFRVEEIMRNFGTVKFM